jgi:elongation factor Ts
MTQISAAEVNKLRKMTGAGMMDCKKALQESEGDVEKAIDYLRKKGQKVASKRADREANEGMVIARTTADKQFGVVLMLNCETDFVGKNQEFQDFANMLTDLAIQNQCKSTEELMAVKLDGITVSDKLAEMIGKTGEKMDISGYAHIEAAEVAAYNHQGNRLATILGLNKVGFGELGHEIAMQVAAMAPVAVDENGVPADIRERELEIGREQARQEGKPENMIDRIAEGKLNKFFKENTLLNQQYIRDSKLNVAEHIKAQDKDLQITGFFRLMLGE